MLLSFKYKVVPHFPWPLLPLLRATLSPFMLSFRTLGGLRKKMGCSLTIVRHRSDLKIISTSFLYITILQYLKVMLFLNTLESKHQLLRLPFALANDSNTVVYIPLKTHTSLPLITRIRLLYFLKLSNTSFVSRFFLCSFGTELLKVNCVILFALQHIQLDRAVLFVFDVCHLHVRNSCTLPCTSQVLTSCLG